MLLNKIFAFFAVAYFCIVALPAAAAGGSFYLTGNALLEIRHQIDAMSAGLNPVTAVADLRFTYDPLRETISTSKGATHIGIVVVAKDPQSPLKQTLPVTISGATALAILHGITDRHRSIRPPLLERERRGRFSITGYDSGKSVVFNEYFVSPKYFSALANHRTLEICTTSIGYLVDEPSYETKKMDIRYCGSQGEAGRRSQRYL